MIQASSTTMLIGRQDFRVGSLQTVIPIYDLVDESASDVRTAYTEQQTPPSIAGVPPRASPQNWPSVRCSDARPCRHLYSTMKAPLTMSIPQAYLTDPAFFGVNST